MNQPSKKFIDSLKKGDLAFADNLAVRVLHVIRLQRSAYEDDINDLSKHLTKKDRERKIAEIEPKRKALWSASAICGVRGETGNWGHINRYYWSPRESPSLHLVCKACMKAWKKLGEPEIVSFDRTAKPEEAWPWDLPFGWNEVPTVGHPWDVPPDKDPEQVKMRSTLRTGLESLNSKPYIAMACHHQKRGEQRPCAGWLHHQLGVGNNLGLRMRVAAGKLPVPIIDGEQHETLPDEET